MSILIGALIAAAAAYILLRALRCGGGREDGMHSSRIGHGLRRLRDNKQKYAVMTEALLSETGDEALLEAVLSGLWAKMKNDLSDAPEVMAQETRGRRFIYAIYAVTGGMGQEGLARLKAGADAVFLPLCAEALEAIGAMGSAAILREALGAEGGADDWDAPYLESFEAEKGKEKMVAFIRANAGEFVDRV